MKETAVITGAARGIGLEMCRILSERGHTVFAVPRTRNSDELDRLERSSDAVHVVPCDVGDDASVQQATDAIGGKTDRVDWLFNNAGIYPGKRGSIESTEWSDLQLAFDINAVGPLRVTRAMLPLLRRGEGKRVIQMTSLMGSIADNGSGGSYAYRMSKTALNMATRNLAHDLGREGFVCLAIHPGWVRTDMGGAGAPLALRDGAEEVLRVALTTGADENGAFKGPGGRTLPF